jgi:hypothetical protein
LLGLLMLLTSDAWGLAPTLDLDANDSSGVIDGHFQTTWVQGGGAITLADGDATLVDASSANLSSLGVTLLNRPDGTNEVLSAVTTGTPITASYNAGTGALSLTGAASPALYQQVLRTIRYNNTAPQPTGSTRVLDVMASDGSESTERSTVLLVQLTGQTLRTSYAPAFTSLADNGYELKADQPWGQTFRHTTGSGNYSVRKVGVVLAAASDAPTNATLTISLRSTWGGANLASATLSVAAIATAEAWYEFSLGPVTLVDGTNYRLRVDSSSFDGKVYLGVDDAGTYSTGDLINKDGNAEPGKDAAFRILSVPPNTAPTISSIANQTTAEDTAIGPIAFTIGDDLTAAASLAVTGTSGNTNLIPHSGIVLGGSGTNRTVTLTPAANQNGGPATITLTVSDGSLTATNQFTLTVTAVDDPPTAADGQVTGVEDVAQVFAWAQFQVTDLDSPVTTNTAVRLQSLPGDGRLEVFNGTSWEPATLLQTVTQSTMNAGWFRFVPDAQESGHDGYATPGVGHLFRDYAAFDFAPVQPSAPGNPGPDFTLTIDLTPVADTPSVTDASTPAETQTTSGLVIARNPADGTEVTHFRITSITDGTLFQNDGVSVITNGTFITRTQGQAGLRFTPATGFSGSAGFAVQASTSNEASGLGGNTVNATITVTPRDQTITFPPIPEQEPSDSVVLSATATSGLAVTFAVSSGPATITNSNQLTFTEAGSVTITASQSGNAVWNPAVDVSRTFLVNTVPQPASPTLERWPLGGVKVRTTNLLGTDADGDAIVLLSAGPTTLHGGTVSTNATWVFYLPAAGFTQADSFAYVVGDAHGTTNSGTVTIALSTDDAPTPNYSLTDLGAGAAQVSFSAIPGRTYAVQYTDSLTPPDWQELTVETADATGQIQVTDSPPGQPESRHYRLLHVQP